MVRLGRSRDENQPAYDAAKWKLFRQAVRAKPEICSAYSGKFVRRMMESILLQVFRRGCLHCPF
jgi:hypothetical protein